MKHSDTSAPDGSYGNQRQFARAASSRQQVQESPCCALGDSITDKTVVSVLCAVIPSPSLIIPLGNCIFRGTQAKWIGRLLQGLHYEGDDVLRPGGLSWQRAAEASYSCV